jgi:putative membrane protein
MKYLLWLLKAAIFFTLFAFALNNQHDATVYFFFGTSWRAPLVLVVLAAFAGGLVVGALGMLPGWWKHRSAAAQLPGAAAPAATTSPMPTPPAATTDLPAVRQHGL